MNGDGFFYHRRVAYVDTDAMGVVHHSNFLRYFEEARVAWLRARGLQAYHAPRYDLVLAVLESGCQHFKSVFFDDELILKMQIRRERLKIRFAYAIYCPERTDAAVASGYTLHVPLTQQLQVRRLPAPLVDVLEKEAWTETWP